MNAELISMVRSIAKHGADWRINEVLNRAADALEAAEKRIKELESQAAFFDAEKQNYQENIEYRDERIKELEARLQKQDRDICMTSIGTLYVPNYDD